MGGYRHAELINGIIHNNKNMALTITGVPSSLASQTASKSTSSGAPAQINAAGNVIGGAVTSKGISYNGTDIIGGSSVNKANTDVTVPATDINKQTPASLVASPYANNAQNIGGLSNNILSSISIGQNGQPSVDTQVKPVAAATPTLEDMLSKQLNLQSQNAPVKTEDIYNKAYNEAGIANKQQLVNNYTAQLNAIQAKAQADQLSLTGQGRGVPEVIIGGQQAQVAKEAAIQALPVSAQLAAAQGDLALAQQHLDTMFKLQVADATAQYEYKNKIIDTVMQYATKAEQRQFEAQQTENNRAYETEKANAARQNEWAKIAIAQPDVMAQFTALDPKSPTFAKDFSKIQSKVIDYTGQQERLLNKYKIQTAKAEAERIAGGANSNDLLAYASDMASTGKLPSPTEVKASGLTVGQVAQMAREIPQPKGFIVSASTGVKDQKVPQTEQTDFQRLYNITQNVKRLAELDKQRIGGIIAGVLGKIGGSDVQSEYVATRKSIVDDLSRMQSGAALTPDEVAFYEDYLPGRFSEPFGFGQDSDEVISNFSTIMNNRLNERLASNGLNIYGYSTVDVGGKSYVIGDTIELENGKRGTILPGGKISTSN